MTGGDPVFVDTNVLVYLRDASERTKQKRAEQWITRLWKKRSGRLSAQVLSEYYVTVTVKLDPGLTPDRARQDIRDLLAWRPIPLDANVFEGAWVVQDRFGFSWWDALIVAAARASGCKYLLTEDLQEGQDLDGIEVISPFERSPTEFFE